MATKETATFTIPEASFSWVDKSPTLSILHLEVIVMTVIGRNADTWIVTASHGQPAGDFPTKESAQRYAVKFAAAMIEKTLTKLSELEASIDSPANGYRPTPCHLLVLQLDPHDSFVGKDGEVAVDVFEQKRQELIDTHRVRLRAMLAGINR